MTTRLRRDFSPAAMRTLRRGTPKCPGYCVWSKDYGDSAAQYGSDVAIDCQGNILVAGEVFDFADFNKNFAVARLNTSDGRLVQRFDPAAHDRLMALTSHLPHALANVVLNHAGSVRVDGHEPIGAAGGSLRDMFSTVSTELELNPMWTFPCPGSRNALPAG